MHKNKIGLEAEFLLLNGEGNLVYPADHGFGYDEWPILAEIRGEPGEDIPTVVASFYLNFVAAQVRAAEAGLTIDLTGFATISPEFYAEIMKRMGTKTVAECRNIYGTDILTHDDRVVKGGKVLEVNISTGLHVHFSSGVEKNYTTSYPDPHLYEPVTLDLKKLGPITLYRRLEGKSDKQPLEHSIFLSRITLPVVEHIVKKMDELLPQYASGMPKLKYRMPGFYEVKAYGFEYRSLPFTGAVLNDLPTIVGYAFDLLGGIDL